MKNIIIGCPFDNGIRSMLRFSRGITGADEGPDAIFSVFEKEYLEKYRDIKMEMLSLQKYNLKIDANNMHELAFRRAQKDATIQAQDTMTKKIKELCEQGYTTLGIGGDHSISYALCRGVCEANPCKKVGIIYIDAHFDMRQLDEGEVISSGNSFRRLIEDETLNISGDNIVVIGIHHSVSEIYCELEKYAISKNVTIVYDDEVKDIDKIVKNALEIAGRNTDLIYLSVDIDSVNEQFVPGVSAPAERGITDEQLYGLIKGIAKDNRVSAFDIVETSSRKLAWTELVKNEKRNETEKERTEKLARTAKIAAKAIDSFLSAK
ncbi:MAG: arginase family protein [Candidatus Paceibacterota bacterium]|jgi:formimidoylglutamase|nr:arginase family protein [Candidatus Paceibacterota bacterium]